MNAFQPSILQSFERRWFRARPEAHRVLARAPTSMAGMGRAWSSGVSAGWSMVPVLFARTPVPSICTVLDLGGNVS